ELRRGADAARSRDGGPGGYVRHVHCDGSCERHSGHRCDRSVTRGRSGCAVGRADCDNDAHDQAMTRNAEAPVTRHPHALRRVLLFAAAAFGLTPATALAQLTSVALTPTP